MQTIIPVKCPYSVTPAHVPGALNNTAPFMTLESVMMVDYSDDEQKLLFVYLCQSCLTVATVWFDPRTGEIE